MIRHFMPATLVVMATFVQSAAAFSIDIPNITLPATPAAEDNVVVVRGSATKGPIANATVNVYELDDTGFPLGSPLVTTTTNDSGAFSLALSDFTEILLVETSGGSFIDESDSRPFEQRRRIQLGNGEGFMSIIEPGQSSVAITPITDALVERARIGGRLGGFDDIMKSIIDQSTEGFGFSLFTTEPADPSNPGGASGAPLTYAYLLGTTANVINVASLRMGMATPTFEVIKAVIWDISDGDLDGLQDGAPIMVGNKTLPFVDFDQQLIRFRNNNFAGFGNATPPDWPDADIALGLGVPRTFFGVQGNTDQPLRFGIEVFPWAKVALNSDGTGSFADGRGVGTFEWAGAGGNLILDFGASGGYQSLPFDSFTFDAATQQNVQTSLVFIVDRIEMFVGQNEFGDEVLFVTEERRTQSTNLATGSVEEFSFEADTQVFPFDAMNTLPFDDPATLEFDPALPAFNSAALSFGRIAGIEGLDVDRMQFNADGTGNTVYENELFTWRLEADGHLRIDFNNGESGDYYLLLDDDPEFGSYVAVDYTRNGTAFHFGSTVISKDPSLGFTEELVIGSWEAPGSARLDDDTISDRSGVYRHFPDGTGIGEFPFVDLTNGNALIFPSSFTICWDIDSSGIFTRSRVLTFDGQFGRGPLVSPEACGTLAEVNFDFRRVHDLYQQDGDRIETVIRYFEELCFFTGDFTNDCNEPLFNLDIEPAIYNKIETYTGVPPIAVDDFSQTSPDVPVTINVLSNDLAQSFQIDPSTVEIIAGPFEFTNNGGLIADGTLEVDPVSGAVTFTPAPGKLTDRSIVYNYRVSDTDGNKSTTAVSFVDIFSGSAKTKPGLAEARRKLLQVER